MTVTNVKIHRLVENSDVKAIASATLDNEFEIRDLRIIDGRKGPFVAMPRRKDPGGKWWDIVRPLNDDFRAMLEAHVLREYYGFEEGR